MCKKNPRPTGNERRQYADQALAELRSAVAAGLKNCQRLCTDLALEPLRPRKDFQELILGG